ncbi:S8 family serine peptidase [Flavobacterium silvaticum]|uniref:S8 family serine peptidase n=1 Tax=Flavobacterium silvaticum TaxID=1852020 RepID=A0A972FKX9_9FLAO|nr:S8 family serine peptidase [Flavobacterium silvaticum]NMH27572.1 S8 family serine peptidase [Flavobacterium silvaticum]
MNKWLALIFLPSLLLSQTPQQREEIKSKTNTVSLQRFATASSQKFLQQKKRAFQLSKQYGWPAIIEKSGSYSQLVGLRNGDKPVYFSTYNYGSGITSRANTLYTGGSLGLNINGENMIAGIWDAGSGFPEHEIFSGRLTVMDGATQTHYHATHVCGTVIGTDQVQEGAARGMAYKAFGHSYDWNNDVSETAQAAADGLLLSNHSYGYNPDFLDDYQWGKYDEESAAFDQVMFNAPYYQFVCAAGNSRGNYNLTKNGYDLLAGHATSKNAVVVAAVNEVLDYEGPASVVMSGFSSWGPTDDGRIKPDLCTKGVNVLSSTNESIVSYGSLSGTSMASPGVTGTLLLLQQYYQQKNNSFMRAATLRGLAIHTADEAGNDPGPDYAFGWGLINAGAAAQVITKKGLQSYISENTLNQGQTYDLNVTALGDEPMFATICWTDPAAAPSNDILDDPASKLVNDLDIRIIQNGNTIYPWKLDPANVTAAATTGDNLVDNVERAQIALPSGNYTIRVSHKGNLQGGNQPYSLIVSGVSIKEFWFEATQDTLSLCQGSTEAAYQFNLNTRNNFSGNITLTAQGLPTGVTASISPSNMTAAGTFTVNLNGVQTLSQGIYNFNIVGNSANGDFSFPLTLEIYQPIVTVPAIISPANGIGSISQPVSLQWAADTNVQQFEVQVSADASFTNIIQQQSLSGNTLTLSDLTDSSTYFWRIRAVNSCGTGNYTSPYSFTTACASPSNIHILNATSTTATLAWTDTTGSSSWQIMVVPQNSGPTGTFVTASTNPFLIQDLSPVSCYDFYVKSNCSSGNSALSGPFSFCTQLDYCAGAHFYDTGGINGSYPNDQSYTTVIFPQQLNERVVATFNLFSTEEDFDFMSVYNGPDTNGELLFYGSGDFLPANIVSTHITGALTFVFVSDEFVTEAGWDISFTCEPLPACAAQPNNLDLLFVNNNSATFEWNENSGAESWEYMVVPEGNVIGSAWNTTASLPLTVTGLSSNVCYDFYIRSVCGATTSEIAGPLTFCTQPDYCAGALFTDSGGVDDNYADEETTLVTIYPAQPGHTVTANFTYFSTEEDYDFFRIYDGPDSTNPLIYFGSGTDSPGTVTSTHATGALTFYFVSDQFVNEGGWEAEIDCETLGLDGADEQILRYYPNPVSTDFHINAKLPIAHFEVYDMNLRRLQSAGISSDAFSIDMSGYSAGIYMVRLTDTQGRSTNIKVMHK